MTHHADSHFMPLPSSVGFLDQTAASPHPEPYQQPSLHLEGSLNRDRGVDGKFQNLLICQLRNSLCHCTSAAHSSPLCIASSVSPLPVPDAFLKSGKSKHSHRRGEDLPKTNCHWPAAMALSGITSSSNIWKIFLTAISSYNPRDEAQLLQLHGFEKSPQNCFHSLFWMT